MVKGKFSEVNTVIQPALFSTTIDDAFADNISKHNYVIEEVELNDITFQAGQSEPIHRWFRLTPSYSPELVRYFIDRFEVNKNANVLDPFGGRGTTAIECNLKNIHSTTIELNPLLYRIINNSLSLEKNINITLFEEFTQELQDCVNTSRGLTIEEYLESDQVILPKIHDVFRWWKKDVLKNLLIARRIIRSRKYIPIEKYLWIALASSCLDCANIHRNHPTITFHDDHNRNIQVVDDLLNKISNIKNDLMSLEEVRSLVNKNNKVILGDSRKLSSLLPPKSISHVITSPPYPNRFSYIHQTRPQLYFMELVTDKKEPTELDLKAIGGTWGRATSNLMKSLIPPPSDIASFLSFYDELSEKSILMCNYATKYFADMHQHIRELRKTVATGFKGAYVVGNSRLSGVEIYTEQILAKIFEIEGFKVDSIIIFRKRGGRKKLYETAVCISI